MLATLISSNRRALRRSSMVLVTVAALTACDTESPVAPRSTQVPSGPNAAALSNKRFARVAWEAVGIDGKLVGGSVFKWNYTNGSVLVGDNSTLDLDKTLGKFLIEGDSLLGFGICPQTAAKGYVFPNNNCFGIPTPSGQTTFLGQFGMTPEYSAYWWTHDGTSLVGPATYKITSKTSRFSMTVVDEGSSDWWTGMGNTWVLLPAGGDYEVCQTKPAPGTALADPVCKKITVSYAQAYNAGFFMTKPL